MAFLNLDESFISRIDTSRFINNVEAIESENITWTESKLRQLKFISRRKSPELYALLSKKVLPKYENEKKIDLPQFRSSKLATNVAVNSAVISESNQSVGNEMRILLQDQKDLSRKDLEETLNDRSLLLESVAEMTGILKETMQSLSSTVIEQNMQLDSIHDYATENKTQLASQKKKMAEATENLKLSFCATISILLFVVAAFICTYILIRLIPDNNKSSSDICPVARLPDPEL